jgi:hypothetical protein
VCVRRRGNRSHRGRATGRQNLSCSRFLTCSRFHPPIHPVSLLSLSHFEYKIRVACGVYACVSGVPLPLSAPSRRARRVIASALQQKFPLSRPAAIVAEHVGSRAQARARTITQVARDMTH